MAAQAECNPQNLNHLVNLPVQPNQCRAAIIYAPWVQLGDKFQCIFGQCLMSHLSNSFYCSFHQGMIDGGVQVHLYTKGTVEQFNNLIFGNTDVYMDQQIKRLVNTVTVAKLALQENGTNGDARKKLNRINKIIGVEELQDDEGEKKLSSLQKLAATAISTFGADFIKGNAVRQYVQQPDSTEQELQQQLSVLSEELNVKITRFQAEQSRIELSAFPQRMVELVILFLKLISSTLNGGQEQMTINHYVQQINSALDDLDFATERHNGGESCIQTVVPTYKVMMELIKQSINLSTNIFRETQFYNFLNERQRIDYLLSCVKVMEQVDFMNNYLNQVCARRK